MVQWTVRRSCRSGDRARQLGNALCVLRCAWCAPRTAHRVPFTSPAVSDTPTPVVPTVGCSRRRFVGTAAMAAGAIAATPLGASPLAALGAPALIGRRRAAAPADALDLVELPLDGLRAEMAAGRMTARSATEWYLSRIEAIDSAGPTLRAVLERNPEALAIADQLDAERRAGRVRGPLHGIPVLIKDNIDTADRMHTSAGSLALAASTPPHDSWVAARLRAAGAILLGKTNLSEWANFRSTHASSGWSGRGGQTRNAYALNRSPSGSSSGSGTAAAASLCAAAIGTETDGSVTSPSAGQGLVGIKPTVGLVSRAGIVPISHSQDTAGPMARTVRDAALLLGALTGVDPRDPATAASRGHALGDYTRALDPDGLRGARIGVARKRYSGYLPAVDARLEAALDVMRRQGATIVDPADLATAGEFDDAEFTVLLYEFKHDLNAYLATLRPGATVRSLADLIAFDRAHAAEEMPFFGQELFEMAEAKGPLTEQAYVDARAKCVELSRTKGIDATLAEHRLDAIVAPTQAPVWCIDHVNGDTVAGGSFTSPAAVAGYPHVTVPMGLVGGLPVGLSFVGTAWSEPTLLRLAYAFEQAGRMREAPRYEGWI